MEDPTAPSWLCMGEEDCWASDKDNLGEEPEVGFEEGQNQGITITRHAS